MSMKMSIEESIRIVQEWKASGLSQHKFGELKGLSRDQIAYQVNKVRQQSPESLVDPPVEKAEFMAVPQEHLDRSSCMYGTGEIADQSALMFQTGVGSLQVTNQIDPYLLRVAMEVMLSC